MSDEKRVDMRLAEIDEVLRTVITFNLNAAAVIGRRLASGNQAIADAIAQDLKNLKSEPMENVNKDLHDHYIDTLSTMITGKA